MPTQKPIAIVGVSALFPGSVDSRGFWRDILAGKDLIGEVPPSHWLLEDYYDADPATPDKTYANRGAFLNDVDFAPMNFGVPPNILAATDTGQLLAMIVARQLLDDTFAGSFEDEDRSQVGVVLGVASTTELCLHMAGRLQKPVWEEGMRRSGLGPKEVDAISEKISEMFVPWEESTFPGLLGNVVSGRIANRFDLGGTNCVVDAACASSLAALEMAINQLSLGQADMMIAGGVDALNDILMYMCFSKTGALSQSGDCRPFSSNADGTMLGEGLGMFALKRLEDAEANDDQIYAVIRGVGSSSDGRAKSIYAPRPAGQARALRRAYESAGYGPRSVEMVEAHGTATPAGDAAEVGGLREVFVSDDEENQKWCALGSVKSQIGHTKAAAGAAGFFKAVMALNHRILPPTIKVDEPNPALELDESPFYLNTSPRPWIRGTDHPRRNAVSAFGFGGTNFHFTLEEYVGSGRQAPRRRALDSELVLLSAKTRTELIEQCNELTKDLDDAGILSHLARTTQKDFDVDKPARLAIVATDSDDLKAKFDQATSLIENFDEDDGNKTVSTPTGVYFGLNVDPGDVAFLFPGQGSQYIGMGAQWAMHFDSARKVWDEITDLEFDAKTRLDQVVFPPPTFNEDEQNAQREQLTATEWAQPALGATSLSILAILEEMGLQPSCAGGHSYGEISALCAAGVFGREDMLRISRKRGELMAAQSNTPGSMTAVVATIEELTNLLDVWDADVVVANHNSPEQVVLSGPTEAITDVERRLQEESISFTRLSVSTAFHSSLVSGSSEPFLEFLKEIEFDHSDFPVYANSLAAAYPDDPDEMREILAGQLAKPVRFVEQVHDMHKQGVRTFVEIGPRNILTRLVGKCLDGESHYGVNLDRRGKSGTESLWQAAGYLSILGVKLDFQPLWKGYEDISDPRQTKKAAFTVPLNGTNYGKPYPEDNPRPQPTPIARTAESTKKIDSDGIKRPSKSKISAATQSQKTQSSAPNGANHRPTTNGVTRANGVTDMTKSDDKNGSISAPPANAWRPNSTGTADAPGWIEAFREQQRQTAEAHRTYQETTAASHQAFLETMESSFSALGQIVSGEPVAKSSRNERRPVRQTPAAPAATTRPQTTQQVQPTSQFPQGAPIASPPTNGAAPVAKAVPAPAPAPSAPTSAKLKTPASAPVNAEINVENILLQVVADKTGYPGEMLEPEMELEADLGVDSIKQVEIMAQMEEEIPGLPDVEASDLAELRTLSSIAAHLKDLMSSSTSSTSATTAQSSTTGGHKAAEEAPDVEAILLEVVADKTGYPGEMLEPEMELEADLGVDSIKQVEIMAQMEERLPGLPEIEASELAELRSLQAIAKHIGGLLGGRTPRSSSSNKSGQQESSDDDSESDHAPSAIGRYPVRPVESAAGQWTMAGLREVEELFVVSKGSDVAAALVEELKNRGISATPVKELAPEARAAIFVDGLRTIETYEEAASINEHALSTAKTLATGDHSPQFFVTVQDTGGEFTTSAGSRERALLAGIGALAKTAAAEWPKASVKCIDLEMADRAPHIIATAIAEELFQGGPEPEVGISARGRRVTPVAHRESVQTNSRWQGLEEEDVIVVSGGGKGVTATSIIELARELPLRFVLLGRTELVDEPAVFEGIDDDAMIKKTILEEATKNGEKLSPRDLQWRAKHLRSCREIRQTMTQLKKSGSKVRYASSDVRNTGELQELLSDVRSQWGPISGFIHGAGVLADSLIEKKTPEQFDRVFGTKIEGLQALLTATEADPLKMICLFSSVAARSGNPGQSDYAMANEVLNKMAHAETVRRNRDGEEPTCRVKSLGWGPWDGGMVTPALKAHFESEGVVLLPQKTGARMLVDELLYAPHEDVEVVLGGSVAAEGMNGSHLSRGVSAEIFIDATTHPYLGSHRLREIAVVPAMLAIEWFTRFAGACCPDLVVKSCRNIKVRKGILLNGYDEDGDLLTIRATTAESKSYPVLEMEIRGPDDTLHYTATVEMNSKFDLPANGLAEAFEIDVPESPWKVDEVYEPGLLFHGPDFHVLTELGGLGEDGGTASLHGLRRMDWPAENWKTDPAAMDGALQIGLLWGLELIGHQTLPLNIERFTPFVDAPSDEPLTCQVRRKKHTRRHIVADVLICTAAGTPQAMLEGVEMFSVPDGV